MSIYDDYNTANSKPKSVSRLEKYIIIGGDCEPLLFNILDSDGNKVSLDGYDITWEMVNRNDTKVSILKKSLTNGIGIEVDGKVKVDFSYSDTCDLVGQYIYQLGLISASGKKYFPCEGIIEILENIGEK